MNRLFVFAIILVFSCPLIHGQLQVGTWRDQLSYNRGSHIAVSDEKVYCAAGGGIIVYNKEDRSLEKLSKVHGLSDVDISSIHWSDENHLLIVGYSNGNLDLLEENKIVNLSDIIRSSVPGSKSIDNIITVGQKAYLSCSFGIVVVDLDQMEISDTYFLGDGNARLVINDMTFDGTFLYAATSSGLYKADINSLNLLDFSSWTRIDFLPEPGALFSSVEWFNDNLYAVQLTGTGSYASYKTDGVYWEYFSDISAMPAIFRMYGNSLAFIQESETVIFTGSSAGITIDGYGFWGIAMRDVATEDDGSIWIADRIHGLVTNEGGQYSILTPAGPYSNRAFSISSYPGRTWFAAGGYTQALGNLWNNGEFSLYRDEAWTSRLNYDIRDVVSVKEHPLDPEIQFLATWGYGLIEYRSGEYHERFGEENSSLQSIIPGGDAVRISGMAFDDENNLWLTNTGVSEPVSVKKANGEWKSFPYGALINHEHTGKIIVNRLGQKWVLLPRGGGLFVFDNNVDIDETSDDLTRKFSIEDETNTLISNEVYSIAEDHNGFIWVGSHNGVAVYYSPSGVFTDEHFYASRIVVTDTGEDELGYLLNNEIVTSIAIDGANRKWFGTEKSGVFLVSEDGTRQIHHFTRQNSPLLSNTISDISIEPSSGEVFFGTSAGVVSFRGEATASQQGFKNVYVFPNPVRENYDGPVTVTGLIDKSIVKITDISGNLVYETVSLGGQAIWDGRNSRGNRVRTGIYLVFISTSDGSETHVTKLMFIH